MLPNAAAMRVNAICSTLTLHAWNWLISWICELSKIPCRFILHWSLLYLSTEDIKTLNSSPGWESVKTVNLKQCNTTRIYCKKVAMKCNAHFIKSILSSSLLLATLTTTRCFLFVQKCDKLEKSCPHEFIHRGLGCSKEEIFMDHLGP